MIKFVRDSQDKYLDDNKQYNDYFKFYKDTAPAEWKENKDILLVMHGATGHEIEAMCRYISDCFEVGCFWFSSCGKLCIKVEDKDDEILRFLHKATRLFANDAYLNEPNDRGYFSGGY